MGLCEMEGDGPMRFRKLCGQTFAHFFSHFQLFNLFSFRLLFFIDVQKAGRAQVRIYSVDPRKAIAPVIFEQTSCIATNE